MESPPQLKSRFICFKLGISNGIILFLLFYKERHICVSLEEIYVISLLNKESVVFTDVRKYHNAMRGLHRGHFASLSNFRNVGKQTSTCHTWFLPSFSVFLYA